MFLLYDLILFLAALVLLPYFLLRSLFQKGERLGIGQRLGIYRADDLAPLAGKRVFWVHAVSVGETRAAIPLIRALKKAYPDCALVLSNTTPNGHVIGSAVPDIDLCVYFPFDHSWVVRRVLRRFAPELIVIVETELWPNFIRHARQMEIPVVMANGRISDRSFPRYRRIRSFLRPVLDRFTAFCMQSEGDAGKIQALGAEQAKIEVTRNLKFDMQAELPGAKEVTARKASYRLPQDAVIWVAGSTHDGEEEPVVDSFRQLVAEGYQLVLVLAPRHPERSAAVGEMLAGRDLRHVLRSELDREQHGLQAGEVLLVDSVGELLTLYSIADFVFVGGSLVPVGGHNVLEASLFEKPVLFGPHMTNFKEIAALVLGAGGGLRVHDGHELLGMARQLLDNPDMRRSMGRGGHGLISANAGATAHTMKVIGGILECAR